MTGAGAGAERGLPYQIAILPTPFPVDGDTGPADGADGGPGKAGDAGADGTGASTEPTWLGPRLTGPVVPGAADGRMGGAGTPGRDGGKGRTGGASKIAEVTIGDLAGTLTLLASAGRGGDGGAGGDGGRGGDGGNGAPAQRTLLGVIPPGRGGDGGDGGDGGSGGRGGHGGIASNVFVSLPADQADRVRVLAHPSAGGSGGDGGRGAPGGAAGQGGEHYLLPGAPAAARPDGDPGPSGTGGRSGRDGRPRPAPPVYVNEHAVQPMTGQVQLPPPAAEVRTLDTRRGSLSVLTASAETTERGER